MYPLIAKDGLVLQFVATVALFCLAVWAAFFLQNTEHRVHIQEPTSSVLDRLLSYNGKFLKLAVSDLVCLFVAKETLKGSTTLS